MPGRRLREKASRGIRRPLARFEPTQRTTPYADSYTSFP